MLSKDRVMGIEFTLADDTYAPISDQDQDAETKEEEERSVPGLLGQLDALLRQRLADDQALRFGLADDISHLLDRQAVK